MGHHRTGLPDNPQRIPHGHTEQLRLHPGRDLPEGIVPEQTEPAAELPERQGTDPATVRQCSGGVMSRGVEGELQGADLHALGRSEPDGRTAEEHRASSRLPPDRHLPPLEVPHPVSPPGNTPSLRQPRQPGSQGERPPTHSPPSRPGEPLEQHVPCPGRQATQPGPRWRQFLSHHRIGNQPGNQGHLLPDRVRIHHREGPARQHGLLDPAILEDPAVLCGQRPGLRGGE